MFFLAVVTKRVFALIWCWVLFNKIGNYKYITVNLENRLITSITYISEVYSLGQVVEDRSPLLTFLKKKGGISFTHTHKYFFFIITWLLAFSLPQKAHSQYSWVSLLPRVIYESWLQYQQFSFILSLDLNGFLKEVKKSVIHKTIRIPTA